jgi:hypothetical protein
MTTTDSSKPLWRPEPDDLAHWYGTFEVFAASSPAGGDHFHGPHIATPVDLHRVQEGLTWLEKNHGPGLEARPLPTLEEMIVALKARRHPRNDRATRDSGSPCHNFWHWIHGD